MSIKFFSAGFYLEECNFVITGLPTTSKAKNISDSIFIVEKLLLRGLPTKPSTFLDNEMGKHFPGINFHTSQKPAFISTKVPTWDNTIKGSSKNPESNPARDFFNDILPNHLKDYAFITRLIQPECYFREFLTNFLPKERIKGDNQADFFLDLVDCCIEVDGPQHKVEPQRSHDRARDASLALRNIKTFRFPVASISALDTGFHANIESLKKILGQSSVLDRYKTAFDENWHAKERYENTLTAIMRLQITILELIKSGILGVNATKWSLNIKTDVQSEIDWVKLSIKDLFEWLIPVAALEGETLKIPELELTVNSKSLSKGKTLDAEIDFKLFERWDDETDGDLIRVRSDYVHNTRVQYNDRIHQIIPAHLQKITKDHSELSAQSGLKQNRKKPARQVNEKTLLAINKQLFGFEKFKDGQLEIIQNILIGENTLGLLPTGGGKSLCFHLSSSLNTGCALVVSPIIALMKDQEAELTNMGFANRVKCLTYSQSPEERELNTFLMKTKKLHFIYISPERVQKDVFREPLTSLSNQGLIGSYIIDEVHCLSEWGHDFRLAYLMLTPTLKKIAPNVPITCLTATASLSVIKDIQIEVGLDDEDIVYKMENSRKELSYKILNPIEKINPSKRENLNIEVKDLSIDKKSALLELMSELKDKGVPSQKSSALIYTPHVNGALGCFPLMNEIKRNDPLLQVGIFAGSTPSTWEPPKQPPDRILKRHPSFGNKDKDYKFNAIKEDNQNQFKQNNIHLMCATKSFGMGFNKPNIRTTIHFGMPSSMESLYQEAGRAGRDGKEADCFVLFSKEPEGIPEYVHSRDTTIDGLKEYSDQKKPPKGDFKTQLWLAQNTVLQIDREVSLVLEVLNYMKKNTGSECVVSGENIKPTKELRAQDIGENVEKAIYRLYQLGFVLDWSVINSFKEHYAVRWKPTNNLEVLEALFKLLTRYDKTNKVKVKNDLDKIMSENPESLILKALVLYLIQWNYDTFVYNRRQSLKTLYEACENYEKTGQKRFKESLDSYFSMDATTLDIQDLVQANVYSKESIDIITNIITIEDENGLKKLKSQRQIEKIQFSLARYLESYKNNPALDLMSGLCRLITNTFDDADGRSRLISYFNEFQNFDGEAEEEINEVIRDRLKLLSPVFIKILNLVKILPKEKITRFCNCTIPHLINPIDLVNMYEILDVEEAALAYIDNVNIRLEAMVG